MSRDTRRPGGCPRRASPASPPWPAGRLTGRMARALLATGLAALGLVSGAALAQEHRAEQTREITYWLLEPSTHSFRISHDFTVDDPGRRHVHNFVRAGSQVSDSAFYDLNTGERLDSHEVSGAEVNALELYPYEVEPDSRAIQAELAEPVAPGHSVRVRVVETYTDPERYYMEDDELVWDRTLGRPYNVVTLPEGWMLTSVSVPAAIDEDEEGRIALRFVNPRPDSLHVVIRARPRGLLSAGPAARQ